MQPPTGGRSALRDFRRGPRPPRFRDKELISTTRGAIRIVDRDGLESTACECYGAVTQPVRPYLAGWRTAQLKIVP